MPINFQVYSDFLGGELKVDINHFLNFVHKMLNCDQDIDEIVLYGE